MTDAKRFIAFDMSAELGTHDLLGVQAAYRTRIQVYSAQI